MLNNLIIKRFKVTHLRKNIASIKKSTNNVDLALAHFDGLYGKVYGRAWPSMRLGLLTPKKQCAVLNSFVDNDELHERMTTEHNAIHLQRYYKKHLLSYTRWQLRKQIIENKKARKREVLAKTMNVPVESIDLESLEVSDVSDSELRGAKSSDSEVEGFSSAEDLQEMFSDRRMDDDERYFINQASTELSLDDFVPATELIYHEEVYDDLAYYEGFTDANLSEAIEFRDEAAWDLSDNPKIYCFPRGDWSKFQQPSTVPRANLLDYYLLDGASLLPFMALDLNMDDKCADYCAAPGGKSLAMLMSLKPKYLLCNDLSASRLGRLSRVMKQFAPDIKYVKSTLELSRNNAASMVFPDTFDKILVDVPCSNDRNSAETLDNNIFKRSRTEERLSLPRTQTDILRSALKSLKPKGAVVYSTCTLSPVENDGVVQKALIQLLEEGCQSKFAVMNLKEAFRPLRGLFRFNTKFKYGQQVIPNVCSNFGPMYISKIKRLS